MSLVKDLIEGGADAVRKLQAEESDTLDYKLDFDENSKEFCKDVSAFANSEGGVLVYGIEEENGRPIGFPGVDISHDVLVAKENIIDTGISPILQAKLKTIEMPESPGKGFIIIDIPYSLDRPHMVTIKGDNRYYHRASRRSVPMSDYLVTAAFAIRNNSLLKIEEIIEPLVSEIESGASSNPVLYIIATPIPPLVGLLPVFEDKLIKPLSDFVNIFTDYNRGTAHMHYVEYGTAEYGYVRTYPNGCILYQRNHWRGDLKEQFLPYAFFQDVVSKFIKCYFDIYNYLGKSRINFYFRLKTLNCKDVYLDKTNLAYPDKRFMRRLSSEIILDKTFNFATIEDDIEGSINSLLAPLKREFGF